ncbi:DUF4157 domain-containing protein [Streptomyces sp. NBC_00140]|uniref:eCIS core domain-containing protein n=1 Tax=Streptomyces sp. NBC_00140 TaxID=2975664 RepID=UPI002255057A|nr:DUF4157 domain-containing protein [Streptomyces sp. NBC_00140]MCX5328347.1 DUF4157 domain-containing protein [Streptomyces sp. NBC_00140]
MNHPATAEGRPPPDEQPPTLGRLLDVRARHRTQALQPRLAWAGPLTAVLRKAEQLGEVVGDRFDRFEGRSSADRVAGHPAPAALVRPPAAAGGRARRAVAATSHKSPSDLGTSAEVRVDGGPGAPGTDGARSDGGEPPELRELPPSTRYRLRQEVGAVADAMLVHDGPHAHALARAADADAVTVGREVYLRQGRYVPHRRDGLALLAHEATHVAAVLEPGRAWRHAVGDDTEERAAREREARILGGMPAPRSSPPLASAPGRIPVAGPAGRTVAAPAAPPASAPGGPRGARAALTDRDVTASPAAPLDLDALRRGVLADVMRQIKTESERGG